MFGSTLESQADLVNTGQKKRSRLQGRCTTTNIEKMPGKIQCLTVESKLSRLKI